MKLLERIKDALSGEHREPRPSPWSHPETSIEPTELDDVEVEHDEGERRAEPPERRHSATR